MIEDLRFVEREVDDGWGRGLTIRRILQAYDGHVWFDVPLYDQRQREEKQAQPSKADPASRNTASRTSEQD